MSALRKLAAMAVVLASVQSAEAMDYSYRLSQDHHLVIVAKGEIFDDDGLRFLRFKMALPPAARQKFDDADGTTVIAFDSIGGHAKGAVSLANIVFVYRLSTRVAAGGQCASGCAIAWAAGLHKSVASHAHVGVHNAVFDWTSAFARSGGVDAHMAKLAGEEVTAKMAEYFHRNGAPDNVFAKTISTPASRMYWLTPEDLAGWKVRIDR